MSVTIQYPNGSKWKFWDDNARQYSEWDTNGVLVPPTPRPYTPTENLRADTDVNVTLTMTNASQLLAKGQAAIDANNNFLNLASPAQSDYNAEVVRLAKENNALIRLVMNLLATTAGT